MIFTFSALPARWQKWAPYIVLGFAVFLAYINVYGNDFLFDDGIIITRNTYLVSWSTFGKLFTASTTEGAHIAGGFFRPLQNLLFFFTYQIAGLSTFAFHLLNIIIHITNACLIFTLGKKLNFNMGVSFLAALVWALHPIHTEAVTYMSATADPLFTMFCLLSILVLLPDFSPRKFLLATPLFILGLFSKENAVVMPMLAVITLYYFGPAPNNWKSYVRTWPLWVATGIYLAWRLTASNLDGPVSYERFYQMPAYANLKLYADHFSFRLYTFFATLPAYLELLVWPRRLYMERNFMIYANFMDPRVLAGFVMCLGAAAHIIFCRSARSKPLNWGLLWFAVTHFPNTGLLIPANAIFLEHWMYLPTIGLCLGGAERLVLLLSPYRPYIKNVAVALTLIVATILGVATFIQNKVWHDPIIFYQHMFKYGVVSARAHNNLALAYMDQQKYTEAIQEFHQAIRISDTYAETHHNLAVCLVNLPDSPQHIPEAIAHLQRALEIDPNFVRSYVALAGIYGYQGEQDKATYYHNKAEALMKDYPH